MYFNPMWLRFLLSTVVLVACGYSLMTFTPGERPSDSFAADAYAWADLA